MNRTVISVENLGKEYFIGGREAGGDTFREMVVSAATAPFRRLRRLRGEGVSEERIWALKEVSFEVKEGEVVGIIGRNGAGKSTLLKILSRITEPSEGRIEIRGRVSSLLEIGTGFHPELTGRENIRLNGAILGMSRAEIDRKLDEIVDFSGVDKFIDTPVKRFSSGMSVRLAFAVAAHLEPQILIVDEVLAVGDAAFQQKCLAKMEDVTRLGRTVLFVSHQLAAVSSLCSRTLLLDKGRTAFLGCTAQAISNYLVSHPETPPGGALAADVPRSGSGKVVLERIWITDVDGREQYTVIAGQTVVFNFLLLNKTHAELRDVKVGFSIHDQFDNTLSILYSDYCGHAFHFGSPETKIACLIPKFPFSAGRYLIHARIVADGEEADWPRSHVAVLKVENGEFYGSVANFHGGLGPTLLSGQWSRSQVAV